MPEPLRLPDEPVSEPVEPPDEPEFEPPDEPELEFPEELPLPLRVELDPVEVSRSWLRVPPVPPCFFLWVVVLSVLVPSDDPLEEDPDVPWSEPMAPPVPVVPMPLPEPLVAPVPLPDVDAA